MNKIKIDDRGLATTGGLAPGDMFTYEAFDESDIVYMVVRGGGRLAAFVDTLGSAGSAGAVVRTVRLHNGQIDFWNTDTPVTLVKRVTVEKE